MTDDLADTFTGRAHKFITGFLSNAYAEMIYSKPYTLDLVKKSREAWRKFGVPFYHEETSSDGAYIRTPYLSAPRIYGELNKKTSEAFLESILKAKRLLPNYLTKILAEAGVAIKVGRTLGDIDPLYRTMKARGQSGVVDNSNGCYDVLDSSVCVSQGYICPLPARNLFIHLSQDRALTTMLHEFGHAIEHIVFPNDRNIENTEGYEHYQDFVNAYRADVACLNGETVNSLGEPITYYLSKEHGGTHDNETAAISELFAQIFSEEYGDPIKALQFVFPQSTKVFGKILYSLRRLVEQSPDFGVICIPADDMAMVKKSFLQAYGL